MRDDTTAGQLDRALYGRADWQVTRGLTHKTSLLHLTRLSISGAHDNGAMERSDGGSGWFSYTNGPHGKDHLAPELRARVEELQARRGRLQCHVLVAVYESDTVPSVGFPPGALFDVETHAEQIADAVNRAKQALQRWH
jgi:hypothetical protein